MCVRHSRVTCTKQRGPSCLFVLYRPEMGRQKKKKDQAVAVTVSFTTQLPQSAGGGRGTLCKMVVGKKLFENYCILFLSWSHYSLIILSPREKWVDATSETQNNTQEY